MSNLDLITCGPLKLIYTQIILGKFFKNVMIVSLTDFYIAFSFKIFKAEIKEFEAILC